MRKKVVKGPRQRKRKKRSKERQALNCLAHFAPKNVVKVYVEGERKIEGDMARKDFEILHPL